MGDPSKGPIPENDRDETEAEAADASWLLRDAPSAEPVPPPRPVVVTEASEGFDFDDSPTASPSPAPERVVAPRSSEGFDFDDSPTASPSPAPERVAAPRSSESFDLADGTPPIPKPPVWTPPGRAAEAGDEPASRRPRPSSRAPTPSTVDQVWSRGAEWGPTLAVLAMWTALVGFLLFLTLGGEYYSLAMLTLAVGMVVGVVLCYPIVITLERPVRIIPEQAAKDFYGALSHHRPHYRRMWLLLSNAGRTSSRFASFEGFQKYWVEKLKQLRQGHAGSSTPLTFVVADFRADKSVGKTAIDAKWTVQVFVRGRREQGPIWSLPVEASFTKGPDGMWYLDDGALAERR